MTGSQNVRFQRKIPTPMDFRGLMFRRAKELLHQKHWAPASQLLLLRGCQSKAQGPLPWSNGSQAHPER